MRILGLDLGTKTLGVSICDNTETIASFIGTIRFTENKPEESFKELEELINEYNVKAFVLGLPKNMNNTYGDATKRSLDFKEMLLKRFSIPVDLQDERLTSVTANKILLEADKQDNTFTIVNDEGKEIKCEVLFTYEDEKTKKNYMAYTDNTLDEEGNTKVYASIYNPEEENPVLLPIETEEEWKLIEGILSSLTADGEEQE